MSNGSLPRLLYSTLSIALFTLIIIALALQSSPSCSAFDRYELVNSLRKGGASFEVTRRYLSGLTPEQLSASLDARSIGHKETALEKAIKHRQYDIATLLAQYRAPFGTKIFLHLFNDFIYLQTASSPVKSTVEGLLLQLASYLPNINTPLNEARDTILTLATKQKDIPLSFVAALLKLGANPNVLSEFIVGNAPNTTTEVVPPLYAAIKNNNIPLIRELLKSNLIDINIGKHSSGSTPIKAAIAINNPLIIELLLTHNPAPNINTPDHDGCSPLLMAMFRNNWHLAKTLLLLNANPHQVSKAGDNALTLLTKSLPPFSQNGNSDISLQLEIFDTLLSIKPAINLNQVDTQGNTALQNLLEKNYLPLATKLIEHGANVNAVGINGNTSLMTVTARGKQNLAFKLLELGATPDHKNFRREDLLTIATEYQLNLKGSAPLSKLIIYLFENGYADYRTWNIANKRVRAPLSIPLNILDNSPIYNCIKNNWVELAMYLWKKQGMQVSHLQQALVFENIEIARRMLTTDGFQLNATDIANLSHFIKNPSIENLIINEYLKNIPIKGKLFAQSFGLRQPTFTEEVRNLSQFVHEWCNYPKELGGIIDGQLANTTSDVHNNLKKSIDSILNFVGQLPPIPRIYTDLAPLNLNQEQLEQCLINGKPIQFETLGQGIYPKYIVTLDNGLKGIFKPDPTKIQNAPTWGNEMQHEVAAYRVDKLINFNRVPPTIIRSMIVPNGQQLEGSFQLFMDKKPEALPLIPSSNPKSADLLTFDYLIRNCDRHEKNIIYSRISGEEIAIDNGMAFNDGPCINRLEQINAREHRDTTLLAPFSYTPSIDLLAHLKNLNEEQIKNSLSKYLSEYELEEFMERRNEVLKLIPQ
ncbi:MAG: ankyrin repeat domain-containing protein [Oligoflexia bacterium]|nr:ankyrin repeat domain-containing protein [Oligoflexia bacterium]